MVVLARSITIRFELTTPYLPDSTAYFFALTHMVVSLILYSFGFAAAIGKWVRIFLPISVGEYDDILPWSVSRILQIKVRDKLDPVNARSQIIESKELPGPTSADFSAVPTVRNLYFFPYTKFLNETDGYFYKKTMFLDISFFDPPMLPSSLYTFFSPMKHSLLYFFLFRRDPQSFSTPCQWGELSR